MIYWDIHRRITGLDNVRKVFPKSWFAEESVENIRKWGANARALGVSQIDNPYGKSEKMPSATGEAFDAWLEKYQAWDDGWKIEDALHDR